MTQARSSPAIVYAVFGGARYYAQLRFSLLTLLDLLLRQPRPQLRIVVYCDKPQDVPSHPQIRTTRITAEELARYRGPLDYVHRVKPSVLARAEREIGLPFLYVDSDTRWLRLPDAELDLLSQADGVTAFMHVCEGTIGLHHEQRYHRMLLRHGELLAAHGIPRQGPWTSWNAGVIGLPVAAAGFFDRVLSLTDRMLLLTLRRTWIEQLATSLLAGSRFRIQAFDGCLEHYWDCSGELSILIQRFLQSLPPDSDLADQAHRCANYVPGPADIAAVREEPAYRRERHRAKWRNTLRKRGLDLRVLRLRLIRGRKPAGTVL